jgi:hypothetical protein|nr:MAG TPA: hypothetical protein [Caudoviricetes sp.]
MRRIVNINYKVRQNACFFHLEVLIYELLIV